MPTGDAKLDAFESLFRSALKEVFHLAPPAVEKVLVLSDGKEDGPSLAESVRGFLSQIDSAQKLEVAVETAWSEQPGPIEAALEAIERHRADLLVVRRHLLSAARNLPHTLGSVVDTLTQATRVPVLLLPPPGTPLPSSTDRVLVVTDHLTGDDALVNLGVQMTHRRGTLFLAHIEDEGLLQYYLDAIDRIAAIDSAVAHDRLREQLLKAPREYIDSVAGVLQRAGIEEKVVPLVRVGRGVAAYQELMAEHDIDLLILNSKDERQQAMHAKAHAIAVQIRSRPLLLL